MVVFRPFVSEVILAKVKSSDEEGIRCVFFPATVARSDLWFQYPWGSLTIYTFPLLTSLNHRLCESYFLRVPFHEVTFSQ
jgi:hypothetical protein